MQKLTPTKPSPAHDPAGPQPADARELRCDCGKLLARVVHSVLELKCPRCKRAVLLMDGRRFEAVGVGSCSCTAKPSPVM